MIGIAATTKQNTLVKLNFFKLTCDMFRNDRFWLTTLEMAYHHGR